MKIKENDCWRLLLEKLEIIIKIRFFKLIRFENGISWKQDGKWRRKNGCFIKLSRKLEDETRNEISRQFNQFEIGNGNGGIISVLWGLNWFYDTKA